MASPLCTWNDKKLVEREDNIRDVMNYWDSKKNVRETIGNSNSELYRDAIKTMTENMFQGKSLSMDVTLEPYEIKRIKYEIDKLDNRIANGTMGSFKLNWMVGESISMKHPLARSYYEGLNSAVNFERNYHDQSVYAIRDISADITSALVKFGGKDFHKDLRLLQAEYFKTSDGTPANERIKRDIEKKLATLTETSEGGKVLKDYMGLVQMPTKQFKVEKGKYDINIRNAASSTRKLLNTIGKEVALPGLDNLYEAVIRKHNDGKMPTFVDKDLSRFKEKIDAAKERILGAIKKGGYFPHIMLEDIHRANQAMQNKVLNTKTKDGTKRGLEGKDGLLEAVDMIIPNNLKAETPFGAEMWNADPIEVLQRYTTDIIAFNKINNIAKQYYKVMPAIHNKKIDSQFLKGMYEFINDTFQLTTKGFTERPEWVNDMSRTLLSAYTLKTMGFSTTGAMRNLFSGVYFFGGVGSVKTVKALNQYKVDKRFAGDEKSIKEIVTEVEKEQGFHFTQADAVTDLVADGIISATTDRNSVVYDPQNNKLYYKDKGVKKTVDDILAKTTTFSLGMHRAFENLTRTALFRSSFIQSYGELSKTDMRPEQRRIAAKNFALRIVNQYAFEYAPHAKARMVGGAAPKGPIDPVTGKPAASFRDKASWVGQHTFQFLHFPMSFLQNQARIFGGVKSGLMSGGVEGMIHAPEFRQALNFAAVNMAVTALSIGLNANLNNIVENDTVNRFKSLVEHLTSDPDVEGRKRGLVSEFIGPIPGDMLFAMKLAMMNDMPEGAMAEMLLGDIDLSDKDTRQKQIHYHIATEWGRWANKYGPSISNGQGWDMLARHLMSSYESDWTRYYNRKIFEGLGFRDKSTYKRKTSSREKTIRKLTNLSAKLKKGGY